MLQKSSNFDMFKNIIHYKKLNLTDKTAIIQHFKKNKCDKSKLKGRIVFTNL